MRLTSTDRPLVVVSLAAALCLYAAYALTLGRWWLSGAAAPVVAWLLWRRHPRARFGAYVLLSVVVVRSAILHAWGALAFGAGAILLLQTPGARRAWPRLGRGRTRGDAARGGGDRMSRS